MLSGAYYNEIDRSKAAWLRELIRRDLIAAGEVDERSIVDVQPDDLRGFTQCHFFAGIGVWSYALRQARWDDTRPVWTGSCPCQPFSVAGSGKGTSDARHLFPEWFRLTRECQPSTLFGEQVASPDGLQWLDAVSTALEGAGYAVGAADLCAAGVGAPHIRQRLYFVANSLRARCQVAAPFRAGRGPTRGTAGKELTACDGRSLGDSSSGGLGIDGGTQRDPGHVDESEQAGELGHADIEGSQGRERSGNMEVCGGSGTLRSASATGVLGGMADADGGNAGTEGEQRSGIDGLRTESRCADGRAGNDERTRKSFWGGADWIPCRDGKARAVEPGTFPLAYGAPARVVRLRGYGDAIVAPLAEEFISAYLEVIA